MADVGIYCKNANIQAKAGAGASAVSKATAWTDVIVLDVESYINCATKHNWSDGYASLNVDVKYILMECASNLCAIYVILYDMSGYASRIDAEDMINVLYRRAKECLEVLKAEAWIAGA